MTDWKRSARAASEFLLLQEFARRARVAAGGVALARDGAREEARGGQHAHQRLILRIGFGAVAEVIEPGDEGDLRDGEGQAHAVEPVAQRHEHDRQEEHVEQVCRVLQRIKQQQPDQHACDEGRRRHADSERGIEHLRARLRARSAKHERRDHRDADHVADEQRHGHPRLLPHREKARARQHNRDEHAGQQRAAERRAQQERHVRHALHALVETHGARQPGDECVHRRDEGGDEQRRRPVHGRFAEPCFGDEGADEQREGGGWVAARHGGEQHAEPRAPRRDRHAAGRAQVAQPFEDYVDRDVAEEARRRTRGAPGHGALVRLARVHGALWRGLHGRRPGVARRRVSWRPSRRSPSPLRPTSSPRIRHSATPKPGHPKAAGTRRAPEPPSPWLRPSPHSHPR